MPDAGSHKATDMRLALLQVWGICARHLVSNKLQEHELVIFQALLLLSCEDGLHALQAIPEWYRPSQWEFKQIRIVTDP